MPPLFNLLKMKKLLGSTLGFFVGLFFVRFLGEGGIATMSTPKWILFLFVLLVSLIKFYSQRKDKEKIRF